VKQTAEAEAHILVGRSPQIAETRRLIEKAARHTLPVLLLGETGTGKEVVARAIHAARPRGTFVPIDCGSLVGTLMESELFGHTRGAFSGAAESKKGLVELANGGTAFFDEIGDLPLEMQVKLLRLVQEREFRAVGALIWRKVDVRLIAATHRDLKAEAARGRFREDLYYRLNVFTIRLAPLRERRGDIPLLIEHFLARARDAGLPALELPPEIVQMLMAYDWRGNVRELKHTIDRMAAMYSGGALYDLLPTAVLNHEASRGLHRLSHAVSGPLSEVTLATPSRIIPPPGSATLSVHDAERHAIRRALVATNGERAAAAKHLGIGRATLYRKMKRYGIVAGAEAP
jgi:DNA-binding NtrC family response regulator